jgi:hypothetical protein
MNSTDVIDEKYNLLDQGVNSVSLLQTDWHRAPIEARQTAASSILEGIPTWICHSEQVGYFVRQTSGQRAYTIWVEGEPSKANQSKKIYGMTFIDCDWESDNEERIRQEIESWTR